MAQIRLTSWFLWSRAIARIGHHHSSWHPIIETSLQEPCECKNGWPLGRWKVIEGWHSDARRMDKIDDFLSTISLFSRKNFIMTQVYRFSPELIWQKWNIAVGWRVENRNLETNRIIITQQTRTKLENRNVFPVAAHKRSFTLSYCIEVPTKMFINVQQTILWNIFGFHSSVTFYRVLSGWVVERIIIGHNINIQSSPHEPRLSVVLDF